MGAVWAVWGVAWAEEPAPVVPNPAEYSRLAQEIELLASKNAWAGVEKAFVAARGTGVALTVPVLVRGAEAAQAAGDIAETRERLLEASKRAAPEDAEPVINWLYDLEKRFWGFRLRCDLESGLPPFEADQVPFDPVAVRAIRFAQEQMHESCAFSGMLPVGTYHLGDHVFVVHAGTPNPTSLDLRGAVIGKAERTAAREKWVALGLEP